MAAQRVDADRPEAHIDLGALFLERGRYEDAETEIRSALSLQPSHVPAWVDAADLRRVHEARAPKPPAVDRDLEMKSREVIYKEPSVGLRMITARIGRMGEHGWAQRAWESLLTNVRADATCLGQFPVESTPLSRHESRTARCISSGRVRRAAGYAPNPARAGQGRNQRCLERRPSVAARR